jgi:hypothetical protein
VLVKLLVLVVLAVSLGGLRDATLVVDEVSILEVEPEPVSEVVHVEYDAPHARPRHLRTLAEILLSPPRSFDAGGVFRPPRLLAA